MKKTFPLLVTLFGLAGLGMGCSTTTPAPSNSTTRTTSTQQGNLPQRVEVPKLGFSYVPIEPNGTTSSSGTRLLFAVQTESAYADFIERVPTTPTESMQEAVQTVLKKTAASPSSCSIVMTTSTEGTWDWLPGNWNIATIVDKEIFIPSTNDIYAYLRATAHPHATTTELKHICNISPECGWASGDIIEGRIQADCGAYVKDAHYHSVSQFIQDPAHPSIVLFVHTNGAGGAAPAFNGGEIQILP